MLKGVNLTLLIGPLVPVPAPRAVLEALTDLTVTSNDTGRSGFQQRELFGDGQWCVIGQHHPARTQPDTSGLRGEVGDHNRRTGRRHSRHVVVLGYPIAGVTQPVGGLRQADGGRQ